MKVDVDGPLRAFKDLRENSLPFVIARALTMTAQAGQKAAQALERGVFKLRNDWTVRNTKITPATKQNLVASVYTDTSNHSSGAPDYLARQQDGGEKVPVNGRKMLAIPTQYLRRMAPGTIPAELRPRNLLGALGGRYTAFKRGSGQIALRNQKIVNGFVFFLQTMQGGRLAIMGRYMTENEAYPFYILVPDARINARFPMDKTVIEITEREFPAMLTKAANETIANDLLQGSGVRVKL